MEARGAARVRMVLLCALLTTVSASSLVQADKLPATCSSVDSCPLRGSALLQTGQVRKANSIVLDAGEDAADFCCHWAADSSDICGTCTSMARASEWCGRSQSRCEGCTGATWCPAGRAHPEKTPVEAPPPRTTAAPLSRATPSPAGATVAPRSPTVSAGWAGENMKMTHYWDCAGQGCDASTLQPWDKQRYVSPSGYGPQDPTDFGGAMYGETMWLTGAASDALSALMGDDDGCCGADPNDGGVGGCGKCALVQNPDSLHPDWTAVVMKKNRCPPWSNGCGAGEPHFDVAAPGFDNLQWSTANVCGLQPGTGFSSQSQSETLGAWWNKCANTAECTRLCDGLPKRFQRGCRLFASWGWLRGNPDKVKYRPVECPPEFVKHVSALFGAKGPADRL